MIPPLFFIYMKYENTKCENMKRGTITENLIGLGIWIIILQVLYVIACGIWQAFSEGNYMFAISASALMMIIVGVLKMIIWGTD